MAYTPVLKNTGVRLEINNPKFEEGFNGARGFGFKGHIVDQDTGKRYKITGKSCGLKCACDAWAEEVPAQTVKKKKA